MLEHYYEGFEEEMKNREVLEVMKLERREEIEEGEDEVCR